MKIHLLKWVLITFCVCAVVFPAAFESQQASAHHTAKYKKSSEAKKAAVKRSKKSKRSKKAKKKRYRKVSKKRSKRASKKSKKRYSKKRSKRSKRSRKAKKRSTRRKRSRNYVYYTCDQQSPAVLRAKARPYEPVIQKASRTYGVNPNLIKAVITAETCFRPRARSPKGAKGLMQLMPATGRRFGTTRRYNVYENIHAGTAYLRWLLNRYGGSVPHAVAAYNSGEGTVDKYGVHVPYKETKNYTRRVLNAFKKYSRPQQYQPRAQQRRVAQQRQRHQYNVQQQRQRRQKQTQRGSAQRGAQQYNGALQTLSCRMAPRSLYLTSQVRNSGNIRSFYYTVGDNETLYQVAHRTGVHANDIRSYNKLRSVHLRPGLRLKVSQCHL